MTYHDVIKLWAARQLTERSSHTGPFAIVRVEVETLEYTAGEPSIEIAIRFTHDRSRCSICSSFDSPHDHTVWYYGDIDSIAIILNELLSLDGEPAPTVPEGQQS